MASFRLRRATAALGIALATGCADGSTTPDPPVTPRLASLTIRPGSLALEVGQERPLAIDARDSVGGAIANAIVEWRSDAPAIATVDNLGVVRALSPGQVRISANAAGSSGPLSALATVTVTPVVTSISQWQVARSGLTDDAFLAMWDDGAGTTYAGGQNGRLVRSVNEGPWTIVPLPSGITETVVGIWGASPTDLWLVGSGGLILRGNGTTFTRVAAPLSGGTWLEVWGLSASEVYITGDGGRMMRWNGSSFEVLPTGVSDELWGIWGPNSTTLFAVGNNGTIIRWDGAQWRRQFNPDPAPLFDIWGTSAGNIFAVGINGVVLRFDGVNWTKMTTPANVNLFALRGRAFNDVYAVGNAGATWWFDGATWRALQIGNGQNLRALSLRPDGSARLAGWYGTVVRLRGIGANAAATTEISDPSLLSVYGGPSGPLFAVGFGGTMLRRTATGSWGQEPIPSAGDLFGISGNGAADIVAVGDTGTILRYDGVTWRRDAPPTTRLLRATWSGGGQHLLVGEFGTILRSNGSGWSPQASGTTRFLRAIWGSDPTNVFAVGDSGTVLRFDGGQWSAMAVPTARRLRAIWGTSASDLFVVGDSGTALRYDGRVWEALAAGTTRDLRALWGRGPTEVYAAGDSGTVLRYDGRGWRTIANPLTGIVYTLFGLPNGAGVVAAGEGARIWEGR
jgi:hypothetical protein